MAALAGDLEGNIVGGVALDLEGTSGQVVEVLVEKLDGRSDGEHCAFRREMPRWKSRRALEPRSYVVGRLGNI
jgi:hypothetical protein